MWALEKNLCRLKSVECVYVFAIGTLFTCQIALNSTSNLMIYFRQLIDVSFCSSIHRCVYARHSVPVYVLFSAPLHCINHEAHYKFCTIYHNFCERRAVLYWFAFHMKYRIFSRATNQIILEAKHTILVSSMAPKLKIKLT